MAKTTKQKKAKFSPDEMRVNDLLTDLMWLFSMQTYERTITFVKSDAKEVLYASVQLDQKYRRITIKIYPAFFKQPRKEQRETLCHELSHTLLWDQNMQAVDLLNGKLHTSDQIEHVNENTTSHISIILDLLLGGGGQFYLNAYKKYVEEPTTKKKEKKK